MLERSGGVSAGPESMDDFRRRETSRDGAIASFPPAERGDPSRIGSYRVLRRLGRGGMGEVYLAMRDDGPIQRAVALKVVRAGMDAVDVLTRFERERQILAALDHPNIARLIDAGQTEDGVPYFVMEYVDGLPIHEHCDARRLTIRERIELFSQVCSAVHHAHRNLVVHRDIKPRNILVTKDGAPKLLDFGIAKILNPGLSPLVEMPTAAGLQLMTPEYASPEQIRGEPVTTAADVYSLGVVLFELLTGHRPFRIKTRMLAEVERVVCTQDPERPSEAISRVDGDEVDVTGADGKTTSASVSTVTPESVSKVRGAPPQKIRRVLEGDLDNIVLKALRKEPQRRYTSAQELADDIRRHLCGQTVIARPDTFSYRTGKFVSRHRGAVSAACLAALSLVGGSAGVAWQAHVAKSERNRAVDARAKADDRLESVRSAVNELLVTFPGLLEKVPGATEARETLVAWGRGYLDRLRTDVADHPELIEDLATGYQKIGEVRAALRNPGRRDLGSALEHFEEALVLRRRQAADRPEDVDVQRKLAAVLMLKGDVLRQSNELEPAAALYRESLAIREQIVKSSESGAADRRGLAIALAVDGDVKFKSGDVEGAVTAFQRSVTLRRDLMMADPASMDLKRDLSVGLTRLGWATENQGRLDAGERLYEEAVELRREIAVSNPEDSRAARDLMTAEAMLAGVLLKRERHSDAVAAFEKRLTTAQALAEGDPANGRAALDLAMGYDDLGRARMASGDPQGASDLHAKAIEIWERQLASSAGDAVAAEGLATAHERLGLALEEVGADPIGAVHHVHAALDLRQREPLANTDQGLGVNRLQVALARLLMAAGRMQESRSLLTNALSWYAEQPAVHVFLLEDRELAEVEMGRWRLLSGDAAGAVEQITAARNRLTTPDAASLVALAEARLQAGQAAKAREALDQAAVLLERAQARPATAALKARWSAVERSLAGNSND